MNGVLLDVDVSISTKKANHQFVVISRDINDTGTLAGLTQDFLDDIVMLLRPINSAAHRPDIDEITHNVKRIEIILAKKVEQCCGVTTARAQVRVGDPRSAIMPRPRQLFWRFPK